MPKIKDSIDIILPNFNSSKFISQTIKSIMLQNYKNWKLIIVDDCSSDSTVNLIRSIPDKRIKLHINNINVDHVKTFERAIKIAKGDYIFLSDQDDIWVEGRVDKMIECMVLNNYDVLFSNSTKCSSCDGITVIEKIFGELMEQ